MKAAIITLAGISSRFNEGIPESEKIHKSIYFEGEKKDTILFHLLKKCIFADKIILVGGYKYDDIKDYIDSLPDEYKKKITLTYNEHFEDLASGYSLYVGLNELFKEKENIEEVLFIEGDLDVDKTSFDKIVKADKSVLTYSFEPIYAKKAVVLYKDAEDRFKYAFNSSHGLLKIDDQFSVILNSGQTWKFTDINKLKEANDEFYEKEKDGTNLKIIQNYINRCSSDDFCLVSIDRWTNCNTRDDYKKLLTYWEEDENENIK
ncbi:DUF6564 domain-containing protein [Eubacterium ruminantium]|uniref:DUF6564 domain-containing protein n=1 Tax=Eubacterium ruminantium TaxID=42322 RepID=UPI00156A0748|nr:DUF6564 domain-containing protein [Eubacterium ruminantium]